MIKLLIGGSPCTYWSIAQNAKDRETSAKGLGWELFLNYLIAKNYPNIIQHGDAFSVREDGWSL